MVAPTLRLSNDVIDRHVLEREVGPTPIAQPLLLSIERVSMGSGSSGVFRTDAGCPCGE